MKSRERALAELEQLGTIWLSGLDDYSEDEFRRIPEGGGWTIGQVYAHVIDAMATFAIPKLERCLDPDRPATTRGRNLLGHAFFLWGGFPPVRIRITISKGYAPEQPPSIGAARAFLRDALARAVSAAARASSAPPGRRSRHPLFGHLSPDDWVVFMAAHTRHHLRQKRRIDRRLRGAG